MSIGLYDSLSQAKLFYYMMRSWFSTSCRPRSTALSIYGTTKYALVLKVEPGVLRDEDC